MPATLRLALAVLLFTAGNVALARNGERSRRAAALLIVVLSAGYIVFALFWPPR